MVKVASTMGRTTAAARNRVPQTMVTLQHVARILDVPRYHLYLASFARVRHQRYVVRRTNFSREPR